jgi:hypothetical protein
LPPDKTVGTGTKIKTGRSPKTGSLKTSLTRKKKKAPAWMTKSLVRPWAKKGNAAILKALSE